MMYSSKNILFLELWPIIRIAWTPSYLDWPDFCSNQNSFGTYPFVQRIQRTLRDLLCVPFSWTFSWWKYLMPLINMALSLATLSLISVIKMLSSVFTLITERPFCLYFFSREMFVYSYFCFLVWIQFSVQDKYSTGFTLFYPHKNKWPNNLCTNAVHVMKTLMASEI